MRCGLCCSSVSTPGASSCLHCSHHIVVLYIQFTNNYLVRLFKLRVSEIVQELCCCFRVVVFMCDTGNVLHAQGHRVKEREDVRIESQLGMVSEV